MRPVEYVSKCILNMNCLKSQERVGQAFQIVYFTCLHNRVNLDLTVNRTTQQVAPYFPGIGVINKFVQCNFCSVVSIST